MPTVASKQWSAKNGDPTNNVCIVLNTDGTTAIGIGTDTPAYNFDMPTGSARIGSIGGSWTFADAVSKVVPGATSFSIRNHADSLNNFSILDAGNIGISVAPVAGTLVRLAPTATNNASAYGIRNDPTWTDPGAGGVNYAFSDNTALNFTGNNTAANISGYYSQIISDTSAFNTSAAISSFKGLIQWNGTGNVTGTLTGILTVAGTGTTSTGTLNEIGGAHINSQHKGSGTVTLMYGCVARADLSGTGGAADGNVGTQAAFYSENYFSGVAVTPGVATIVYDYLASGPNFTSASVTNTVTAYYNFKNTNAFNTYNNTSTTGGWIAGAAWFTTGKQGGNTSGSNTNYGVQINGTGGVGASGGTITNRALEITLPSPTAAGGSTTTNFGIFILGNGGSGGSTTNTSFRNDSTAASLFKGPVTLGTNIAPTAPTMQRFVATPLVALASGASVTWDGVLVDTSTLTISGSTGITSAGGVNLMTMKAPALVATGLAVTNSATLAIVGPPTISGGGTITNPYPFWVQSGASRFDAPIIQAHLTTAAINSTNTATAAQAATGYITSTSAAPTTITLPTGTLLGAALGAVQGTVFDLIVDNTAGASTVTIAVAVNGILSADAVANGASLGLLTIPSGVTGQGQFRLMFSSATAYTFSRVA